MMISQWLLKCPACGGRLTVVENVAEGACDHRFECIDGVWRFLTVERTAELAQFMRDYEAVRTFEKRGAAESDYYRALPYQDLSEEMTDGWRIRAASYDAFLKHVLPTVPAGGRILDLGAGNGWLSGRLAEMGYTVAAVDLMTNDFDGLGAHHHYSTPFLPLQAEFNRLPLADNQVDLILFNASFHYAVNYSHTLAALLPCLLPQGRIAIIDTPFYKRAASGEQMVRERHAHFEKTVGFKSDSLASENFLTHARLAALGIGLGIEWQLFKPNFGLKWALRPLRAKLRGHREPAVFMIGLGRVKS